MRFHDVRVETEPRIWGAGAMIGARVGRTLDAGARGALMTLVLIAALPAGVGWLYVLRGLDWFAVGPSVHDSLPLLQLAGFDGQPLALVAVAWLAAGVMAGVVLARVPRLWRALLVGALALVLLLFASQASFALARNLRLSDVLWSRRPGTGPWVEGLLFAAGCALPGSIVRGNRDAGGQARMPDFLNVVLARIGDLGLGRGEHRNAAEHERDRDEVSDERTGAATY